MARCVARKSKRPLRIKNRFDGGGFANFMNGPIGNKISNGAAYFNIGTALAKGKQPSVLDIIGMNTQGTGTYGAVGQGLQDVGNIISGIGNLTQKKQTPLEDIIGIRAYGGPVRKYDYAGQLPLPPGVTSDMLNPLYGTNSNEIFKTPLNVNTSKSLGIKVPTNAEIAANLGGTGGTDLASNITKSVVGLGVNAFQQANNIRDTSDIKKAVSKNRVGAIDDSSLDAVQNASHDINYMNYISKQDLKNTNTAQDVGNVFSAAGQGVKAGAASGNPFIAAGTGILGGLTAGFGLIARNRKLINERNYINKQIDSANAHNALAVGNASENAYKNNNYNAMANYSALGGPLYPYPYSPAGLYNVGDALPYGYMQDRLDLAQQKLNAEGADTDLSNVFASGGGIHINPKNKGKLTATAKRTGKSFSQLAHSKNPLTRKRAIFALNARKWHHGKKHALGGDMQSNGADWDLGYFTIGNGGTHEENPNEGVQLGVDAQGTPNLAEEGEVVRNNYVYSETRLQVDEEAAEQFNLPKSFVGLSYAKAAIKAAKDLEERPNDPISRRGYEAIMQRLQQAQEYARQKLQADKTKEMINNMSPEELQGLMAMANQGMQQQAQDQAMQEQAAQEQMMTQQGIDPNALGASALYGACGGRLARRYVGDETASQQLQLPSTSPVANYGETANEAMWLRFLADNEDKLKDLAWYQNYKQNPTAHNWKYNLSDFLFNNQDYFKSGSIVPDALLREYDSNYANPKPLVNTPKEGVAGVLPYLEKYAELTNNPELFTTFKSAAGDADENGNYNFVGSKGEGLNQYMYNLWKSTQKGNNPIDLGALPSDIQDYIAAQEDTRKGSKLSALRYAGIVPQLVGLGLSARKPNNTYADRLIEAAQNTGYMPVKAEPIGNYLQYTPIDRNFYTNQLAAQANAQRRALINLSNANRGTAAANILASDYNNTKDLGDLAFNTESTNWLRKKEAGEFNKLTNQFNSQQALEAARANQNAALSARNANLSLLAQGLGWQREDEKDRWSNIVGNLGQIGKYLSDVGQDTLNNNLVKTIPGISYAPSLFGQMGYLNIPTSITEAKSAYGGRLRKNRRRRNAQ